MKPGELFDNKYPFLGKTRDGQWGQFKFTNEQMAAHYKKQTRKEKREAEEKKIAEAKKRTIEAAEKNLPAPQRHQALVGKGHGLSLPHLDKMAARGFTNKGSKAAKLRTLGKSLLIPVWNIDGFIVGGQVAADQPRPGQGKYIWAQKPTPGNEKPNLSHEFAELPLQHVAPHTVNPDGSKIFDYSAIKYLYITEGVLKPLIAYDRLWKEKGDVMVVGYAGNFASVKTLRNTIAKLANLERIVMMPDAGSAHNYQVMVTMAKVQAAVTGADCRHIPMMVGNWGQWEQDKEEGADIDEIDINIKKNMSQWSVFLNAYYKGEEGQRRVSYGHRDQFNSFQMADYASVEKELNGDGIIQRRHLSEKEDWSSIFVRDLTGYVDSVCNPVVDEKTTRLVMMRVGTGAGKSRVVEELVESGLKVLYLCVSPDNASTKFLLSRGGKVLRYPVKSPDKYPVVGKNAPLNADGSPQIYPLTSAKADGNAQPLKKATCSRYQDVVILNKVAAGVNPCKGCPVFAGCTYIAEKEKFSKDLLDLQAKQEGLCVTANAQTFAQTRGLLSEVKFDLVLLDDDTIFAILEKIYTKDQIKKIIAWIGKIGNPEIALQLLAILLSETSGETESRYGTIDSQLMSKFKELPANIMHYLAGMESDLHDSIEFDGKEVLEEGKGEEWMQDGGTRVDPYTKEVKKTFIDNTAEAKQKRRMHYELARAAHANRMEALEARVLSGDASDFFKTIVNTPYAHIVSCGELDPDNPGGIKVRALNHQLIENLKSMAHVTCVFDGTQIPDVTMTTFGMLADECVDYVSSDRDNSFLTIVQSTDTGILNKNCSASEATLQSNFAIELARKYGRNTVSIVGNAAWLGRENRERLADAGVVYLTAHGDSRGSNMAEKCEHQVVAASMVINSGAMQSDYRCYYNEVVDFYNQSVKYMAFKSKKLAAELLQTIGRVRHNRSDVEKKIYIPEIDTGTLVEVMDSLHGCKVEEQLITEMCPLDTKKAQAAEVFDIIAEQLRAGHGTNVAAAVRESGATAGDGVTPIDANVFLTRYGKHKQNNKKMGWVKGRRKFETCEDLVSYVKRTTYHAERKDEDVKIYQKLNIDLQHTLVSAKRCADNKLEEAQKLVKTEPTEQEKEAAVHEINTQLAGKLIADRDEQVRLQVVAAVSPLLTAAAAMKALRVLKETNRQEQEDKYKRLAEMDAAAMKAANAPPLVA